MNEKIFEFTLLKVLVSTEILASAPILRGVGDNDDFKSQHIA